MSMSLWVICREAALRIISVHHLMYQYIATWIMTVLGYIIFLPQIGVVGIPLATGFGFLAGIIPTLYQLKKQIGFELPKKRLLAALFAGIGLLAGAIPSLFINNILYNLAYIVLLSVTIYLLWVFFFGPLQLKLFLRNSFSKISF